MNSAHATPAYKKKSKVYKTRIYNQIQSVFQDVLSYVQFPLKISVDLREKNTIKGLTFYLSLLWDVSGLGKHQFGFMAVTSNKLNYVINMSDFRTVKVSLHSIV